MIYDVYWSYRWGNTADVVVGRGLGKSYANEFGVNDGDSWSPKKVLAEFIKQTKDSSFVFCINVDGYNGVDHETNFKNWLKENQLEDLLIHTTDYGITNPDHSSRGIKLHVLMTRDHWYRDLAKDDPEITEENFINFVKWPDDESKAS